MPTCTHCRKAEADPESIGWLGWLPLIFGCPPLIGGRYCKDCATGMLLPWLLLLAALLLAAFVLAVILIG